MINIEDINKIDRIHSYPAKYTAEMLEYYINKYTKKNDVILDPFVGSGTTLLAARWLERRSVGFDINPVAYQISKVKTNTYNKSDLKKINSFEKKTTEFFKNINKEEFEELHTKFNSFTDMIIKYFYNENKDIIFEKNDLKFDVKHKDELIYFIQRKE